MIIYIEHIFIIIRNNSFIVLHANYISINFPVFISRKIEWNYFIEKF